MNEILLSHEETLHLLTEAGNGSEAAQDRLVRSNAGLVKSIAVRFLNRGVEFEELYQIGCIGLVKAGRTDKICNRRRTRCIGRHT